jgi:FkbM family methyltransferase
MSLPLSRQGSAVAPIGPAELPGPAVLSAAALLVPEETPVEQVSQGVEYPATGIISYAQNREDVLLWRALHDVENGFYIDVGAGDPTLDSVTRAFYDRSWRCVNVEPAPGCFEKLCTARPRDLTLQVALGNREGWATLHEFPDTGLSTLVGKLAAGHRAIGLSSVALTVPLLTLTRVWERFVKGEVHFLKIDVEGYERQVLSGADLKKFRPWIILVEATEPMTSEATWEEWEEFLLRARYRPIHFDGLNRWYLAEERSYLKPRFEAPPNVFDQFQLAAMLSLQERAAKAEFTVKQMQSSASWRITAPLRKVRDALGVAYRRICGT